MGVKALIRNEQGQVLLLKVNTKALKKYAGPVYWDIPGGRVKRGERLESTLRREVTEETGIHDLGKLQLVGMVLSNIRIPTADSDVGLILSVYQCKAGISRIKLSEESSDFGWFNPSDAAKLLKHKYPEQFCQLVANMR